MSSCVINDQVYNCITVPKSDRAADPINVLNPEPKFRLRWKRMKNLCCLKNKSKKKIFEYLSWYLKKIFLLSFRAYRQLKIRIQLREFQIAEPTENGSATQRNADYKTIFLWFQDLIRYLCCMYRLWHGTTFLNKDHFTTAVQNRSPLWLGVFCKMVVLVHYGTITVQQLKTYHHFLTARKRGR